MYDPRHTPIGFIWEGGKLECVACGKQMQRPRRAASHRFSKACDDAARKRAAGLRREVRACRVCRAVPRVR